MNKESTGMSKVCFVLVMISAVLILLPDRGLALDIQRVTFWVTEYRTDGVPGGTPYEWGAGVSGEDITEVTMTRPDGVSLPLNRWPTGQFDWGLSVDGYASLATLRADFPVGDYIFVFNGGIDSGSLRHQPVVPMGFANITYPAHGSANVPLNPTFTWDSCVGYGDALNRAVAEEAGAMIGMVFLGNIAETSWAPGPLNPGCLHWMEISVFAGTGQQPYDLQTDHGDHFGCYDLFENCNAVFFTTEGPVQAAVEIDAHTLNLGSKGTFIAFVDLPEGYEEEYIDLSSVTCEAAPALKGLIAEDGRLMVKFDTKALYNVSTGNAVVLTVTGELSNGQTFAGSDTITVIDEGRPSNKYSLQRYFPLVEGITWNYLQTYADGRKNYEVYCVGGTEAVEGEAARKLWEFDSGEIEYYIYSYECMAWTKEALKLYKGVCSDGFYHMYDPPAIRLPRWLRVGETFSHATTRTEYGPDGAFVIAWPYSIELTLECEEDVEVLAGSFTGCLKFSGTEDDEGRQSELTLWLAPGIGEVRRIYRGSENEDRELISFTRPGITCCPRD